MADDTWVCCDSCGKWRRVLQEIADGLDEHTAWYCSDNPDPVYNSCDVPQELTDTEIDERTALPVQEDPADNAPDAAARSGKLRKRPPIWQIISKNIYTHRERRRVDEDEIMICQCKPIWATDTTTVGCGDQCLNRMLNMECVEKYCPCGERCTNQAFTKRQYAKLDVRRAGAKGFGLFTAQDLTPGQFIIEYVGEVLEEEEYDRRKEFYTATGQRHYYFMNIGNGEVIDATRRGGLGRFINHSCEPNCETQKWVVRGELAIGLFALEAIPAGTELTFDYNFERYGDKPMKCLCGSKACRGVIGGSQETALRIAQAVVEPDDEEEMVEPIMVTEKESDAALQAILDRAVGLGWEEGWDAKLTRRLEKLAAQKGIELPVAGDSGASGDEDAEESEDDDVLRAAAAAAAQAAVSRRPKSAARRGKAARPPRAKLTADPDWQEPGGVSAEAEDTVVSATPGQQQQQQRQPREPGAGVRVPKRTPSMPLPASRASVLKGRSEVSRRLDALVTSSDLLSRVDERTVLQVLRLFNLCDIGPTVVKASSATSKAVEPPANGAATASKPTSRAGSAGGSGLAGDSKEEGELGEESPKDSGPPPPPPPMAASAPVGASSIAVDGEELTSRATVRPARGSKGELTQRQRARMADASRLLGVILKTSSLSAQNLFVRCGVLRQLLSCFGHNIKESYNSSAKDAYSTVLAKMLTLVLALSPLSADDVHLTRSANGSFADLARKLTQSRNYEVKNKAWEVLKKFPASACTRPVAGQEGVWHSSAGSTRTRGPPGPAATPSRDRDGDYPSPRPSPYGPPPGRAGSMGYSRELPQAPPSRLGGGGGGPRPQGPAHPGRGGQWGSPAPLPAPGTAPRERPYANGAPWSHEPPPGSRKRSRWDSGEPGPPPVNGAGGRAPMPYPAPHHPSSPPSYGGPPPPRDGPGGYGRGPGGPPPFSEPPSKYRAWAARPDSAQGSHLSETGGMRHRGSWDAEPQWQEDSRHDAPSYYPSGHLPGSNGAHWGGPPPPPGQTAASLPPDSAGLGVPRPPSATFSDVSRGSGEAPPAAPPLPQPNLSPMSDDEDDMPHGNGSAAPAEAGAAVLDVFNGEGSSPEEIPVPGNDPMREGDEREYGPSEDGDTWPEPNKSFDAFVAETVRHRLGKYQQPDHPVRLSADDAQQLYEQIKGEVISKEQHAFRDRQRNGVHKPIERRKLEVRIKDFVRDRVRRWHEKQGVV